MITPSVTGPAGANGWYVGNVTVSWNVSDPESGIAALSGCETKVLTAETPGTTLTCTAVNGANLESSASVTIKLDKTGPTAGLGVSAGTPGANGWYVSDVTVSTTGADDISSPVACTADQFQTTDTVGTAFSGACTNDAGLKTDATPLTVKRDATPPTNVTFDDKIADGGSYYYDAVPAQPTCTADGAVSGLASCVVSGYSTSVGPHTLTATATDNAGNTATATRTYKVGWTFSGFYRPFGRESPRRSRVG